MIHCFATRAHHHLLREFLDSWSPDDIAHLRGVPYEKFPFWKPLPNSVCIFTDMERLLPGELQLAAQLAASLRTFPENYKVINDPGGYAGRFNFLKTLHRQGINDFRVHRVDEIEGGLRFPVFLRNELNHDGPMTPLLHSFDELNRVLADRKFRQPAMRKHLMLIEYCDCSDGSGVFLKYSVMNVVGTLIPRHVLFSDKWSTKKPDIVSAETVAVETEFMENFPHKEKVLEIFRLAGLEYGRIDFGLCHGRIQVWEINTNPTIVPRHAYIDPRRMPLQSRSAQKIVEAMRRVSERQWEGSARPFCSFKFLPHRVIQLLKTIRNKDRR